MESSLFSVHSSFPCLGSGLDTQGLGGDEGSLIPRSILPLSPISLLPFFPSCVHPAGWAHSAKFTLFVPSVLEGVPELFWWAWAQVSDPGLSLCAGLSPQAPDCMADHS